MNTTEKSEFLFEVLNKKYFCIIASLLSMGNFFQTSQL
jgi:hypothetical protein